MEKELRNYKEQLKDKVIFCNCDDPEESNFWLYFKLNFEHLGLKKLISTHYETEKPSYKLEYDGKNIVKTNLVQNGDFRSPECVEILKNSDVVITNPPFSLFREYMSIIAENNKKILIIGNNNAITYKDIFLLIKENKLWLGYSPRNMEFMTSSNEFVQVNANWFTNLETTKRYEKLIMYKTYNEIDYPKYDNYDAINVDKVADIPVDYFGVMGVPITFMDKYNPEQFEILGIANSARWIGYECLTIINDRKLYNRILIKRKDQNYEN